MKRIFKRKIYQELLKWKQEDNGRTALLLQGARRVGKSTIVEEFAQKEYSSYILIDFNKVSEEVKHLFDDLMDLNILFLKLQVIFNIRLKEGASLIIFDEIQRCPLARQAIKYLVQDGRYHYIETGSLISIKQNTKGITIPSEEKRVDMYPMDFEEFLWATNDTVSMPIIKDLFEHKIPMGAALRDTLTKLRLYMLVGGMPQAVNEYLDTNNLSRVDQVKRSIIQLYYDDFMKIDATGRLGKLFMAIPSQLSRNISRYYTHNVVGQLNPDTKDEMLVNLEDSKCVLVSYHACDPNIGMSLTKDTNQYKLFVCDTGLFVTMAFWDKNFTENIIYNKLLFDKLQANLGYVYENLTAQMIAAGGNKLFYYTFPKENDDKHYYEIDFLLSRANKICPIEVKSSGYKSHISIDKFGIKYSSRILNKYLVYSKDLAKDKELLYVPFFMVPLL